MLMAVKFSGGHDIEIPLCVPVTTTASPRHLRSAVRGNVQVLATRTVTFGPRSFVASDSKL